MLHRRIWHTMTKWQQAVDQLIKESGVTVRRWRNTNSGVAYTGADDWGVEIPIPKGPVTFCMAAHEIGHQLKHRGNGKTPRWVEEVEAWEYALAMLERFELPGRPRAVKRATRGVDYAFRKALKRGVPLQAIIDRFPDWVDEVRRATSNEVYKIAT